MDRQVTRTHKGIYGYIEDENKVLVIKKKRGPYTDMYDLPGGSPEKNETEKNTLIREIAEETGCVVKEYSNKRTVIVDFVDFIEDDGRPGYLKHTGILFDCSVEGSPDSLISDQDSNGALWINKAELDDRNATPLLMICIGIK